MTAPGGAVRRTAVRWTVVPSDAPAAVVDGRRAHGDGLLRTRIGSDVVVWQPADDDDRLGRLGRPVRTADGLALVTQVGDAFRAAHPEHPVLLDHGRHLVVPAAGAPPGDGLCWRVEPLPPDTVVVGDAPGPRRRVPDPRAGDVVAALSRDAYDADVTWLASLPTRHSTSASFVAAADRAAARLAGLGFDVARPTVTVGGGTSSNVVADRRGAGGGRRVVLVTAHLDSVNLAGGPAAPAPGADDNGSGAAGVLELARVLAPHAWGADLRCVLFGGEEQGLHGSRQYVAALPPAERARVAAVLNMDMIAVRNGGTRSVLLEGAPLSAALIAALADAAAAHTGLAVQTSLHPFASDHVPFLDAGIAAVLTIEGNDSSNTAIHSDRDTRDRLDLELALEVLRMNAAALAGWLGGAAAVPAQAGPVVARRPGRLDVFGLDPASGVRHAWWDGGRWQPADGPAEQLGGPVAPG